MLLGPSIARNRAAGRGRNRPGLTLAARLEREAMAAARRNNASLWYVRNDLSNVAQNTDGSGAMTLNAPIGLLLDQQWGGALGSELVTNGGFDSGGSGWTPGAGWSVSSGAAIMVSARGSNTYVGQVISFTSGRLYRVQYDLTVNSGQAVVYVGSGGIGVNRTATGTYTEYIQAGIGSTLYLFGIAGFTGSFDNVSVREVLGTHATQATTANKPLLTRVPRTLGPELVVNGGFDTASGWVTENSTWTISGGVASHSGIAANIYQPGLLTIGRAYRIEFTWAGSITGYLRCYAGFGASYSLAAGTAPGRVAVTLTCSGDTILYFQSDSAVSIDNISVREVLEWSYALQFDGSNDALLVGATSGAAFTAIAAAMLSEYTVQQLDRHHHTRTGRCI